MQWIIQQYFKSDRSLERYNLKNSYIIQINEIYSIFKTLIENINIDNFNLDDENLELFNELSSWEEGLIECYENNDNWSNIIELSERVNNNDLRLKGLWHYGSEKHPTIFQIGSFPRTL